MIDSSHELTSTVPVYEGYTVPHAISSSPIGGRFLTERMSKLLMRRGYSFQTFEEKETVRDIMQTLCYFAEDFDMERHTAKSDPALQKEYKLPDGQIVEVGSERFECPEVLFKPELVGKKVNGICTEARSAVMKCDYDVKESQYANILLSGGTTLIPGLDARLQKDMERFAPARMHITVIAPPEREYSAWIGGSTLASLPTFQQMCISKAEYEETAATIVHKKCF